MGVECHCTVSVRTKADADEALFLFLKLAQPADYRFGDYAFEAIRRRDYEDLVVLADEIRSSEPLNASAEKTLSTLERWAKAKGKKTAKATVPLTAEALNL